MQDIALDEDDQITELIEQTARRLKIQAPPWAWNRRFTIKLGRAHYTARPHVEFSSKLWPICTREDRQEVIIHEVCHIAAFVRYHETGHDDVWMALMARMGYDEPMVKHGVDVSKVRSAFDGYCKCRKHRVAKATYTKSKKMGSLLVCKTCRHIIHIEIE